MPHVEVKSCSLIKSQIVIALKSGTGVLTNRLPGRC